ncbi:hypothetical protein CCHR01_13899 [Colletotrichum chrysophilum]|uniref:Uncharacterized protein n=1 Tax=Colletotrichum chrysophilum TaxID=1836956 RepID=A0AAD9EDA7_9PEZI|nr:hypothetical protein CCHR01_13899 [Colletotrichum chrysophilum]
MKPPFASSVELELAAEGWKFLLREEKKPGFPRLARRYAAAAGMAGWIRATTSRTANAIRTVRMVCVCAVCVTESVCPCHDSFYETRRSKGPTAATLILSSQESTSKAPASPACASGTLLPRSFSRARASCVLGFRFVCPPIAIFFSLCP